MTTVIAALLSLMASHFAGVALAPRFPAYVHQVDGVASWYQSGTMTSCGDQYDPDGLSVALGAKFFDRSMCGKTARVTYRGKSVYVTINDRMPENDRIVDLSRGTKNALGAGDLSFITLEF